MDTTQDTKDQGVPMPQGTGYEITAVHYQRLVSLGNYENERVGAWAQVKAGATPEQALDGLRSWVQAQVNQHNEQLALESDIYRLRQEQTALQASVSVSRATYEKVKSFIEGMGLTMPDRYRPDDDMPW